MKEALACLCLMLGCLCAWAEDAKPIKVEVTVVEINPSFRQRHLEAGKPGLPDVRSIFVADVPIREEPANHYTVLIGVQDRERVLAGLRELKDKGVLTCDVLRPQSLETGRPGNWMFACRDSATTVTAETCRAGNKIKLSLDMIVTRRDLAAGTTVAGFTVAGRVSERMRTMTELSPGETVVQGWFVAHRVRPRVERVPVLSILPFVGDYFTSRSFEEFEVETCVLVTVH